MGDFSKQILTRFIDNECERQLFLDLGKNDDRWISPLEKLEPLESIRRGPPGQTKEFGKIYEQQVYKALSYLPNSKFSLSPQNEVVFHQLLRDEFLKIYDGFQQNVTPIIQLEAGFEIPHIFFEQVFGIGSDDKVPITDNKGNKIQVVRKHVYIDVMILGLKAEYKLDDKNIITKVTSADMKKVAINIYDIKKADEENIGKKHFIEILYYQRILNAYLKENNLEDKFFISASNNGIFPGYDHFTITSVDEFLEKVIPITWKEINRLFDRSLLKVRELWKNAPLHIEKTDTNIKTECGRCDYYDDCFKREGGHGPSHTMSVKLLPYTSSSIIQQLKDYNINTIGDLVINLDKKIKPDHIPKPIYAEIPKLRIKGRSLASRSRIIPKLGEIMSVSIPRFNDISIVINLEADPLHSRVFGASVLFTAIVGSKSKFARKFEDWWKYWKDFITGKIDRETIYSQLEHTLDYPIGKKDFKSITKILKSLYAAGLEIRIRDEQYETAKGETKISNITIVTYTGGYINEGLDDQDEYELTKMLIFIMYNFVNLSSYIEHYVVETKQEPDKKTQEVKLVNYYPSTGVYYWSKEILEILQDLLQRQLNNLLVDPDLSEQLNYLIKWFTPSESMVKQSEQMKKIFDLREFVETTQGLPQIINYTWHSVNEELSGYAAHKSYYSKHFNYMDHNVWYGFLSAKESSAEILAGQRKKKSEYRDDIIKQLIQKVRTINRLKNHFQKESRNLISYDNYRPADSSELQRPKVPDFYHDIARIWYLYSRLSGAVSELEANQFRYMYPEYSIGKLAAAKVSDLQIVKVDHNTKKPTFFYKFRIEGLSSNMKLKVKDRVLLLPEELRDFGSNPWNWNITIKTMEWDGFNRSYDVTTEEESKNYLIEYQLQEEVETNPNAWYLYPKGGDYWTTKLAKLLESNNFGGSWLGHRLSYLMGVSVNPPLMAPVEVSIREVYLYYPNLFNNSILNQQNALSTTVKYPPNVSQRKAILNSMNNIISSIQGPPGTGKSQTIVALIDEFLHMKGGSPNILITSFSYQALNVLVDKISESTDKNGNPTLVAQLPRVYLHSAGKSGNTNANNLTVSGKTWSLNGITGRKEGIGAKGRNLSTMFPQGMIIFGVAHQLVKLDMFNKNTKQHFVIPDNFAFDMIIVDEASQMPIDQVIASLKFVRERKISLLNTPSEEYLQSIESLEQINICIQNADELTKLVLVGDSNQLPPVQPIQVPLKLEKILGSLFSYYIIHHGVANEQLETNYRSHEIIVEFTKRLGFYNNLIADTSVATKLLPGDPNQLSDPVIREIFDPSKVVCALIHDHKYETAVSMIEAKITAKLVLAFYNLMKPKTKDEERNFFLECVGVVAPHNAHGRLVIRLIYEELNTSYTPQLDDNELMSVLNSTIFSVEKFQGSDRNFIISTIGISDVDQLAAEEEFIYDINRFNVLTSRAKNKMILICSRAFLDYFPHNRDVMGHYSKISDYVFEYCISSKPVNFQCTEHLQTELLELRFRDEI